MRLNQVSDEIWLKNIRLLAFMNDDMQTIYSDEQKTLNIKQKPISFSKERI